jgi:ATP-dependent helicase/nuclease subunit B
MVKTYLPTRRAARALAAILARECGPAALLPRMVPLGEGAGPGLDQAGKDQPALEGGDRRAQDLLAALAGRMRSGSPPTSKD